MPENHLIRVSEAMTIRDPAFKAATGKGLRSEPQLLGRELKPQQAHDGQTDRQADGRKKEVAHRPGATGITR